MAVLLSGTSGNWSDANTWRMISTASFVNTEFTATSVGTTYVASFSFIPGQVTAEGVILKIASRVTSPTGTMTISMTTGGPPVAGSTVIVNNIDLPLVSLATPTSFYWCYFKFASPINLSPATTYNIIATSSVSAQATLGVISASSQWISGLVLSITASPGSRDTLIVAGAHTSPGVSQSCIVTFDNTSSTIYGSNSAVYPALEIGKNGTVNFQTNGNTNYQLIANGPINIGGGGVMTIGTIGTPMPDTSSALIRFTMSTTNAFQLNIRQRGSIYTYGATKSGRALLGSNASVGVAFLTTKTSTNWNRGDSIVMSPTLQGNNGFDQLTMSATAIGTTLQLNAGPAVAKVVWANTDCEIINLTRNIKIVGPSSSVDCLHTYNGLSTIDMDYTEINNGAFSNSQTEQLSGSIVNFVGCSFWGSISRNLMTDTTIPAGVTMSFEDCVFYSLSSIFAATNFVATTQSTVRFSNSWAIRAASSWTYPSGSNTFTMENCRFIASAGSGIVWGNNSSYDAGPIIIRGCVFKCNGSSGINFGSGNGAYTNIGDQHDISSNRMYLNTGPGFNTGAGTGYSYGWIIGTFEAFSNGTANLQVSLSGDFKFLGATLYGGPTQASTLGIRSTTPTVPIYFDNFIMSTHSSADVSLVNTTQISQLIFRNSSFLSTTKVLTPTTIMSRPSYVYSARDGKVDGTHIIYRFNGTLLNDKIIFRTSPSSLRISPLNATYKLESNPVYVAVESGKTMSVGVWVRRSVVGDGSAYNGNLPRLKCKTNSATWDGNTDIILATASAASNGSFEYISGVTPVAVDNSAFEIVVDVDGTSGWVNVDDMYISKQNSTKGFKYWLNASPIPASNTNNGSAVIFL